MIPRGNITAWRNIAPWPDNAQIEQDLALSRTLVEIFNRPAVREQAVFRGGTALHKLYFDPPGRYSEDIDLVQRQEGPIGPLINEIRGALDGWLGEPRRRAGEGRFTLLYRFDTTFEPVVKMRLKIEINTREHFAALGFTSREFAVDNPWFSGVADVPTFTLSELLGTKLRALHQRKKGRDLFDLAMGIAQESVDVDQLVAAFEKYMEFGRTQVTRAQFEETMARKMTDPTFLGDVRELLRGGLSYDPAEAWESVHGAIVTRLRGEAWRGHAG